MHYLSIPIFIFNILERSSTEHAATSAGGTSSTKCCRGARILTFSHYTQLSRGVRAHSALMGLLHAGRGDNIALHSRATHNPLCLGRARARAYRENRSPLSAAICTSVNARSGSFNLSLEPHVLHTHNHFILT